MTTESSKPFVSLVGVPFDDTDLSMAICRAAFHLGKFYPATPPTATELDEFEATGKIATRHTSMSDDKMIREGCELRQRAINSCGPKYREFVRDMIVMADMLPAVSDALDMVIGKGDKDRTYTLDQLRKAWGAGVHAAKEGRV